MEGKVDQRAAVYMVSNWYILAKTKREEVKHDFSARYILVGNEREEVKHDFFPRGDYSSRCLLDAYFVAAAVAAA